MQQRDKSDYSLKKDKMFTEISKLTAPKYFK